MDSGHTKIKKTLDDDDRISTLPDAILCYILSFLPTKYAVATTVLSTRWKSLFSFISSIDLDDSLRLHRQTSGAHSSNPAVIPNFITFVNKLLLLRNSSLHKFRIKCGPICDNSIINAWICAVILRNVKELDIDVRMRTFGTLPSEIFTCKTIEVLKLEGQFFLNVPSSFCLPNLKVLQLQFIKLDYSFGRVLSNCRLLEDLSIHQCIFENIQVLDISAHSLKKLTLYYCGFHSTIVVDTPNLEYFVFNDNSKKAFYLVKNIKSLIAAHIAFERHYDHLPHLENCPSDAYVAQLIGEMYNVRSLYLSGGYLEALLFSGYSLPMFQNLTIMELGATSLCGWTSLPDLLESSPNLQRLIFMEGLTGNDWYRQVYYLLPERVPVCLAQNLKEIEIRALNGVECEFKLIEYFLQSGQVLEKMKIGSFEAQVFKRWYSSMSQRLCKFKNSSKNCQISLSWRYRAKFRTRLVFQKKNKTI